jgi:hypothetical protein
MLQSADGLRRIGRRYHEQEVAAMARLAVEKA